MTITPDLVVTPGVASRAVMETLLAGSGRVATTLPRGDLVYWSEDHFEVHLQDERGRFARAAVAPESPAAVS